MAVGTFGEATAVAVGRGQGGKYSVGEDNDVKRGFEGGEDRYNGKEQVQDEREDDKKRNRRQ